MTTYTFAPTSNTYQVDWSSPTIWAGGVVPNAPDADVVFPVIYSGGRPYPFDVTIATNEGFSIRSLQMNSDYLDVSGSLSVSQLFNLASGSELIMKAATVSAGSMLIDGTDVQGYGTLNVAGSLKNDTQIAGIGLTINAGSFTNNGQIDAGQNPYTDDNTTTINVTPGNFTNLANGVLTGGLYFSQVGYGQTVPTVLDFNVGQTVSTDAANIDLKGGQLNFYDPASAQYKSLQSTLTTIASNGVLTLEDFETFNATNALTDNGLLQMQGGTLTEPSLTVGASGQISGNGIINGSVQNNGSITATIASSDLANASSESLVVNGNVFGGGQLFVSANLGVFGYASGTLEVNGSSDENVTFQDSVGQLILDHPSNFAGSITSNNPQTYTNSEGQRFEQSFSIVLEGVSYGSVMSYNYAGDASGGTLTVQTTQGTYAYKFVGNYLPSDFALSAGPQPLSTNPPSLLITVTPPIPAPTITGTVAGQNVSDAEPDHPFANAAIGVGNSTDTLTVTVSLSAAANGSLALSGTTPPTISAANYDASTGVFTLVGQAADVNTALKSLVFTPNASGIPAGQSQTTTFTVSVTDDTNGAPVATDSTTSVNAYQGVTFNGGSSAALLLGTPGNDTLSGSAPGAFYFGNGGQDTITLGGANQTVDLNAPGNYGAWGPSQGLDVINGFQSGVDHLAVDMSVFNVSPGSYKFISGPGATPTSASPTFYYDTNTDYLWFDPDGTGGASANLVAFLPGTANLSASDLTPAEISFANGASLVNSTATSTSYGEGQNQTLWATANNETLIGGPYREQFIAQAKNDTIIAGNSGAFIAGLGGNDQLFGGAAGVDTYYFNSPSAGVDTIYNFNDAKGDTIDLQGSNFAAPAGFTFTQGVGFVQGAGATAVAATATLAYDTSTGYLWYDTDGTGPAARTLLAFLPGSPTLHASDFKVV